MLMRKGLALAAALLISSSAVVTVPPAEQAAAATGGCGRRAHGVHTSDRRPFNAWACWIDNGDDIRVCDNNLRNNRHAHAALWLRTSGGNWLRVGLEDDGPDRGCDTEDLKINPETGDTFLRLEICEQDKGQGKHRCVTDDWYEHEA